MKLAIYACLSATALAMVLPLSILGAPTTNVAAAATETEGPTVAAEATNTVVDAVLRDPFWPVGYTPKLDLPEPTNTVTETVLPPVEIKPVAPAEWPELRARGVTETPERDHIAFLDGVGMIVEGDTVRVERGGVVFTWYVVKISKDGAELRRLSAQPKGSR